MTREQAIAHGKEQLEVFGGEHREFIEMAIKALEQEPTTKNNLGVDTVSRKAVHDMLENLPVTVEDKWFNWLQKACMRLAELPSVTPKESQTFKWCTSCKEYDQEKHCCHRWSKVIRNTVAEMKQEYIEREVLDKIRAEIKGMTPTYHNPNWSITDLVPISEVLKLVDKYKAETEAE